MSEGLSHAATYNCLPVLLIMRDTAATSKLGRIT